MIIVTTPPLKDKISQFRRSDDSGNISVLVDLCRRSFRWFYFCVSVLLEGGCRVENSRISVSEVPPGSSAYRRE